MQAVIESLNHVGAQAAGFAWSMFWQSSLLISVIFVVEWALRRRVRAAVRYALWWIVLLKLVLPPSLALPTGPGWWLRSSNPTPAPAPTVLAHYGPELTAHSIPPSSVVLSVAPAPERLSVAGAALAGTAGVSFVLLIWMLVRWRHAARVVRASIAPPAWVERMLDENRRALGLGRPLRLRLLDQAISPAVCGLFRPVILVPRVLVEQLSPVQLRSVLLHELVHLRRGDVFANCFQALLQAAYWWHPLLWLANARMRRVREEAVDDAVVLALRGEGEAYAATLLEVAKLALQRSLATLGLVGILESRSFLRQRVERLLELRPARNAGLSFASILCLLAFGAFALPMGQAPEQKPGPGPSNVLTATNVAEPLLNPENGVPEMPATAAVFAAGTNLSPTPQGRRAVMDNLNRIRLGAITFHDLPLGEVVQQLTEQSRKQDPEGNGVRFTILTQGTNSDGRIDPSTGLPTPAQVNGQSDIASTLVSVRPLLSQAKLVDVVEAIVKSANPPLKWTVSEDGVSFAAKAENEPARLHTRIIKVDPDTFSSGLRNVLGLTGPTDSKTIQQNARDFFASIGVELMPPKSIFFNYLEGAILVRGTLQDIDAIEAAVQE
ncbi:MAG TPA: M56 family metallopeptidase, partial [Clostridia bacterium]|nr:M56 family metallopeptidase [Clostridia bacterium]